MGASLKRKYEQQITTLNQEKIAIEKKWKQKLIALHKKYGVQQSANNNTLNNQININHIENITITPTQNQKLENTQHHSDGSMTFDPNSPSIGFCNNASLQSSVPRSRRKRKRTAVNEFGGSDSTDNHNNSTASVVTKKRVKKRRKVTDSVSQSRSINGSMLNSLLSDANGASSRSQRTSKSKNSSSRKRKGNKSQTPKNKGKKTKKVQQQKKKKKKKKKS